MSIKVGSQIEKLNPSDNYKIVDWADVNDSANIAQNITDLKSTQANLASAIANKVSGVKIADGKGVASDVTEIRFTGSDVTSSNGIANINVPFKHFKTIAERDTWKTKFETVITNDVIVAVDKDASDDIHWYKFDAATRTFSDYDSSGGGTSLNTFVIADAVLDVAANKLEFSSGKILEDGQGGVSYTPYVGVANQGGDYATFAVKQINAVPPLKFEAAMSGPGQVTADEAMLTIDHAAYEPLHAPSFLAYITDDVEIVGKDHHLDKGHHDGRVWFDNIISPAGPYIQLDRNNKAYGIEEADSRDPNVTNGTDYLITLRASMKGVAPEDGFVRVYIYNSSIDPYDPTGYLMDVNGQPMIVEKQFKTGQELGVMQITGVVNAKASMEFSCHVVDSFSIDNVLLEDRTEGGTGLLIQAITPFSKTGAGLQQFELDTQQNLEFSSHYLGSYRCTLNWVTTANIPVAVGPAKQGTTLADGLSFYNLTPAKVGMQDGHVHIEDDGSNICDYHFGKIFSAEETQMLRGHDIDVTVTLVDKQMGFNVALMKWAGKPDEYTPEIFESRNNGSPVFQTGWSESGTLFISEDAIAGDHTLAKTFAIPSDANNYAVIIYPKVAALPSLLQLKELRVDVNPAFTGYVIKEPTILNQLHLHGDLRYKELVQDNQGYDALRYTIGNTEIPMPCGELGTGAADITIAPQMNPIPGSQAKGGEGAIQFQADGNVAIKTNLSLWSEKSKETTSTVEFWYAYATVNSQGAIEYTKIDASHTTFNIQGASVAGTQVSMNTFSISVKAGDMIALRAKSNLVDGAFLEAVAGKPLLKTEITFDELVSNSYDDPFTDIDMSQFDKVYTGIMTATKVVSNKSSVTFNIDIPDDMNISVLSAVKELADLSVRPVKALDWVYSNTTKTLTVSFGETVLLGQVTLGIYV